MVGTVAILAEGKPAATSGAVARLWSVGAGGAQRPRPLPASAEAAPALAVTGLVSQALHDITFTLRPAKSLAWQVWWIAGSANLPRYPRRRRCGAQVALPSPAEMPRRVGPASRSMPAWPCCCQSTGCASAACHALARRKHDAAGLRPLLEADARERSVVDRLIADFDVRPPRPPALFGTLSGGNQQKALLAKWLHLRPAVLVLDDPTSGVDPGRAPRSSSSCATPRAKASASCSSRPNPSSLRHVFARAHSQRRRDRRVPQGRRTHHQAISRWCYA